MSEKPGGSTPQQYGLPEGATELQDLIEHRGMNFALGNIFKACYRRGTCSHSDELRDMRKILWFAQREIDRLEKEEKAVKRFFNASKDLDGTVYGNPNKIEGHFINEVDDEEEPDEITLQPLDEAREQQLNALKHAMQLPLDENAGDEADKARFRRFSPA